MMEVDGNLLFWLGLLVVLGLWMLGAYNRVTALRSAILAAWQQVDSALMARSQALAELMRLAEHALQSEQATLHCVSLAQTQLAEAVDQTRRRPADFDTVARLATADAALQAFSVRLLDLVAHDDALQADAPAQAALQALREAQPRLAFARQLFNDASQHYNLSLAQFPTRLLMPVFRLGPAGQL